MLFLPIAPVAPGILPRFDILVACVVQVWLFYVDLINTWLWQSWPFPFCLNHTSLFLFYHSLTLFLSSCYPIPSDSRRVNQFTFLFWSSDPCQFPWQHCFCTLSPPFSSSGSFIPYCFALLLYSWPSSSVSFSFALYSVWFLCLTLISLPNWCGCCRGTQQLMVTVEKGNGQEGDASQTSVLTHITLSLC